MTPYQVVLTHDARRFVDRADASLQRRLRRCFDILRAEPRKHPSAIRLRGEFAGHYRFRVGHYRVVYWIDEARRTVVVVAIGHRRDVYR
ncbi:MAG: type II toxin-antitoxin system RelE family toxin [bacterium]